jgi:hypothetical protein
MIMMIMRAVKRQALHLLKRRNIKLTGTNVSRRLPLVLATVRQTGGTYSGGNWKTRFPPFVVTLKSSSEEKGHFVELY